MDRDPLSTLPITLPGSPVITDHGLEIALQMCEFHGWLTRNAPRAAEEFVRRGFNDTSRWVCLERKGST